MSRIGETEGREEGESEHQTSEALLALHVREIPLQISDKLL